MIRSVTDLIAAIAADRSKWPEGATLWFRGESEKGPSLCPKVAALTAEQENYLVQTFRRKAGGLANTPIRGETDKWLLLAQHYGTPTRLLDWSEGALVGLFFAINQENPDPRLFMLNAHRLNELAVPGYSSDYLNFPLSWGVDKIGYWNIALAWQERQESRASDLPMAMPTTYQDQRMIAQRSCFTVHGRELRPMREILESKGIDPGECLREYRIDPTEQKNLLGELSMLGVSAATIFPDLEHLTKDLKVEIENP